MQTNVRLIDANALLEEMKKLWNERPASPDDAMGFGIEESITKIKSAPTVDISELQEKAWKYDELCK